VESDAGEITAEMHLWDADNLKSIDQPEIASATKPGATQQRCRRGRGATRGMNSRPVRGLQSSGEKPLYGSPYRFVFRFFK
jgi:hypothetical protein